MTTLLHRAALADAAVDSRALGRLLADLGHPCPLCGCAMDSAGGCAVPKRDGGAYIMPAVWVCRLCELQIEAGVMLAGGAA